MWKNNNNPKGWVLRVYRGTTNFMMLWRRTVKPIKHSLRIGWQKGKPNNFWMLLKHKREHDCNRTKQGAQIKVLGSEGDDSGNE
jgi:hypothetical protein